MFLFSNSIIVSQPYLDYLSSILRSLPTKPVFKRILTKAFCQYIVHLMSKKKLGSLNDLMIDTYFQSFHMFTHLWFASFVKFLWHYWTEFSQSWKDLRKTLRSHENFLSLKDLINGANIYSFKFNWRLVILNVHDVKNESINEQEHAILEKCVNSILYFLKK